MSFPTDKLPTLVPPEQHLDAARALLAAKEGDGLEQHVEIVDRDTLLDELYRLADVNPPEQGVAVIVIGPREPNGDSVATFRWRTP